MSERRVIGTTKNGEEDITGLCNMHEAWSPVSKEEAITHIKEHRHNYYVVLNGKIIDIKIAGNPPSEYLRTDPEKTTENDLIYLPNCPNGM